MRARAAEGDRLSRVWILRFQACQLAPLGLLDLGFCRPLANALDGLKFAHQLFGVLQRVGRGSRAFRAQKIFKDEPALGDLRILEQAHDLC